MIFGWQFFGTVLVLLLLVGWFFRDRLPVEVEGAASEVAPSASRGLIWLGVMLALIAGPLLAVRLAGAMPAASVRLAPPIVAGWESMPAVDAWHPAFHGAAGQLRLAYRSAGGDVVELFHAVYTGKPRRGHTLITYGNNLYDPAQSHILSRGSPQVALADGDQTAAGEMRLSGISGSRLVWYWYCVGSRCTGSATVAKLLQATDVLRGRTPQSAVWALSATIASNDLARTRGTLQTFARQLRLQAIDAPSQPPASMPVAQP
jgi:EpsI family protein